ncbi:MAG: tRNA lysidine(34) synthetase TilS, partial [Bacteroidota bacterium]
RSGDWFMPLGFPHKKKLSDFFIDEKVPLHEKHAIPVVESHGDIVWVCGKRVDDRFKVTEQTRSVVRLEYSREQQ